MSYDLILLYSGLIFLMISLITHYSNKENHTIALLLLSAFCLFLFSATLYPFLNVWDERFHALVAKNLMNHPLMPTLYDKRIVNIEYDRWDRYHIWLHKQPLFLWQIALSFKVFGVNEISLRIPSVIVSVLMVYASYRSGSIVGNKNIGYYTAVLVITSSYLLKLISGRIELDQNDVSFISYISLSIWAFLEYLHSNNRFWLLFIGIFSGFAILCKWLVGLLVYLIWGIYSIMNNRWKIKKYWDITFCFCITIVTFLPWQLLTLKWYPSEANYSLTLNSKHLTEAVDGHSGPIYYHFIQMPAIFGWLAPLLIIPSLFIFFKKCRYDKIALAMILTILFVYAFFSFVVTKMPSFTAVLIIPVYLSMAFFIDFVFSKLQHALNIKLIKLLVIVLYIVVVFSRMNIINVLRNQSFISSEDEKGYRKALTHNKKIFNNLNLPSNAILFNVKGRHYVEAMFYSGLPAYNIIPTSQDYKELHSKGNLIVVFKNEDFVIPEYFNKENTIILPDTIFQCE